jgi:hypothetical protein
MIPILIATKYYSTPGALMATVNLLLLLLLPLLLQQLITNFNVQI